MEFLVPSIEKKSSKFYWNSVLVTKQEFLTVKNCIQRTIISLLATKQKLQVTNQSDNGIWMGLILTDSCPHHQSINVIRNLSHLSKKKKELEATSDVSSLMQSHMTLNVPCDWLCLLLGSSTRDMLCILPSDVQFYTDTYSSVQLEPA